MVQYSVKTSGIPISEVRKQFSQTIAGGVDEIDFDKLTTSEMRKQWTEAREQAGSKYIAAPGCSVPNDSTTCQLARFPGLRASKVFTKHCHQCNRGTAMKTSSVSQQLCLRIHTTAIFQRAPKNNNAAGRRSMT